MYKAAVLQRQDGSIAGRRLMAAVLLGGSLLLTALPAHADFADGVRAYEAGNYTEAYAQWLPLAEKNDVAAMRNIGHLYRWGQGVEKDMAQAMQWYRRAAELGFSRAQANLAAIYLQGEEGIPVNYEEAHKWFAAAAIQGHAVAQYNLGLMYELGLGVEKSEAKALGWYNLAAKAGQPEALERLSQLVARTEPPLLPKGTEVDGRPDVSPPQAAGADTRTESATVAPEVKPAEPLPASPVVSMPVPAMMPVPVPAPAAETPAEPEPAAPAESPEDERPGFFSRFFSAISSGGGVSIPDMFSDDEQPAGQDETKP